MKLTARDIYLDTLARGDCKTLWNDYEYDLEHLTDEVSLGQSDEKAETWFEEIQELQGRQNVRLGIFLYDGSVIGDVALQSIDRVNRRCSVGISIAKLCNRSKGYGRQAVTLMLGYAFEFLGMERVYASTLAANTGAQKSLENCGFLLEGTERESVYLNGKKHDKLHYAILKREYECLKEAGKMAP